MSAWAICGGRRSTSLTWPSASAHSFSPGFFGGKSDLRAPPLQPRLCRIRRRRASPLSDVKEFPVEADSNVRLDLFIAGRAELSRTQAATLIAQGHVLIDGRREKASYRPETGEGVRVEIPKVEKRTVSGEDIPVTIV